MSFSSVEGICKLIKLLFSISSNMENMFSLESFSLILCPTVWINFQYAQIKAGAETYDSSSSPIDDAIICLLIRMVLRVAWEFCFVNFKWNWDNKNKTINYIASGMYCSGNVEPNIWVSCLWFGVCGNTTHRPPLLLVVTGALTHSSPSMRSNRKSVPVNNMWSGSGISVQLVPCVLVPHPPFTDTYLVWQSKLSYDLHNVHL